MTQFVETNALLAVMSDDKPAARAILRDMLDGELSDLADAVDDLSEVIAAEQRARRWTS